MGSRVECAILILRDLITFGFPIDSKFAYLQLRGMAKVMNGTCLREGSVVKPYLYSRSMSKGIEEVHGFYVDVIKSPSRLRKLGNYVKVFLLQNLFAEAVGIIDKVRSSCTLVEGNKISQA